MAKCLALDIGGTKIAIALCENGVLTHRSQIATPSSNLPTQLTKTLDSTLQPLCKQVDFIAVASTGIINNGTLYALNPVNLGGLDKYPLQDVISSISNKPTYVINDGQAAAFAEYQALNSRMDMAFITVSTGVGAGIVINDQLLIGKNGIAGHVGHSIAESSSRLCGCGQIGCVESIASGTAIGELGKVHFGRECTAREVFWQYKNGNALAAAIINQSASTIASMIANLKIILDLEIIKLGGSVGLADGYLKLVRTKIAQMPPSYQITIEHALCGADAGLIGVVKWSELQFNN